MDFITVECPTCLTPLGRMVQHKGEIKLITADGWRVADASRYCSVCGRPFHFKQPKATWEELKAKAYARKGRTEITAYGDGNPTYLG